MPFAFDEIDAQILAKKSALFNERTGPRVGDFVETAEGLKRFTHDWDDSIQVTLWGDKGSFYLSDGYISYSGGLDSAISKDRLENTGKVRDGEIWFFHHDCAGAHRGVFANMPFRVYRIKPTDESQ